MSWDFSSRGTVGLSKNSAMASSAKIFSSFSMSDTVASRVPFSEATSDSADA
uniref:ATP synthase delta chain n=1 Tax=Arundo donax TaxID=35708 RepID=A0A0A9DYT8_ARUDO